MDALWWSAGFLTLCVGVPLLVIKFDPNFKALQNDLFAPPAGDDL